MRGRKPKPTAVKKAAGNPGKRKLNEAEPEFASGVGRPPAVLDAIARAEWRRLAKLFAPHKILQQTDRGILSLYCVAFSAWSRAQKGIIEEGGEVIGDTEGDLVLNPWVRIAREAAADMARFGAMLGLDPTTRTRLVAEGVAAQPYKPILPVKPRTKVDTLPIPT